MQKARYLVALSCACASAACGTEVAQAIYPRPVDAGTPGIPEKPPQCTSAKITDRLTHGSVSVDEGIRYKRTGYFFGLPQDDRIALSTANNGVTMVAWVNSAGTQVHVTPVQVSPLAMGMSRYGPDYLVDGTEVSGLVALDDGFALLTRRPDPGEPIDNGTQAQATYLVRWQNGVEVFALPLTGTSSIVNTAADLKRDFPYGISGRLAFNGSQFGAYFGARGGDGDRYADILADKFVVVSDSGHYLRGWRIGCSRFLGGRLVSDASGFAVFCVSDGNLADPGINVVEGAWDSNRLVFESRSVGYVGGNFGSAVKVDSGYLVAWASRGVTGSDNLPAFDFHEPAVALADHNRRLVPPAEWPFLPPRGSPNRFPTRDAVNVHAAPYGDKVVLLVWETIDSPQFRPNNGQGYSTGAYGGTHFRLVDATGKTASDEEPLPDAIAPNGPDDIVQLPNRDLVWAYVPEGERNFQTLVTPTAVPGLPNISEIRFVRLSYCVP